MASINRILSAATSRTRSRMTFSISIAQHPSDIGRIGVQLAVDYLKSQEEPSKKQVKTGLSIVTRDNLQKPEIQKYLYKAEC